jgi:hypothetical protein
MTSDALRSRSESAFRFIEKRPLLSVVLVPSAPMNELRLWTAGSARITLVNSSCSCAMAPKEMVCGACEMPWITPVSCTGKNPLGTMIYRKIVNTRVARATNNVMVWKRRTNFSVRP